MNYFVNKKIAAAFGSALLVLVVGVILSHTARSANSALFIFGAAAFALLGFGFFSLRRVAIEQRRIADELRLHERAVAATRCGVTISDHRLPDEPLVYVNPAFEKITGYAAAEAIGRNCRFLQGAETDAAALETLRRAVRAGEPCDVTLLNYRKDNSPFWNRVSIAPVTNEAGAITHFIGFQQDVTEWHLLDEKRHEERFRLLVESVKDYAIFMLDVNGNIASWNAGAERVTGYSADEIIGAHFRRFYTAADCARNHPERELEIAIAEGRFEEEGWRVRKDKSEYWCNVVITAVRAANGELRGFAKVTRDITERRRAEQERLRLLDSEREARAAAEEANRHKAEFLANMSHEIRTPMNGVIGMTRLLLKTALTNEQREYSETIRQSANALLVIINDILDFSKIEAGKLRIEQIPFDLRAIVESTIELFAEQAANKNIELVSFVPLNVPISVCGDPNRLRQVLTNLISNALKFTAAGEIVVRVRTTETSETNENADEPAKRIEFRFEVADTGVGISAEAQRRLFQPFVQADGSMTRKFGGTGLGLAISRQLVELMSGKIGVESEPGAGATFWFTAQFAPEPQPRANGELEIANRRALAARRVLIVDRNAATYRVLADYARAWGANAKTAANAADLICELRRAFDENRVYDCLVLDSTLPEMRRFELLAELRNEFGDACPRVVLLNAFGDRANHKQSRAHGVDQFVTKPARARRLLECLSVQTPVCEANLARETDLAVETAAIENTNFDRAKTALIVEDNAVNQRVAQLCAEELGYKTVVANNGVEALRLLSVNEFDVILMDCQMPEMDGYEATAEIRRSEGALRQTPIIAMTANALEGDRERCLAAGMNDYLAKPIDEDELARLLALWSSAEAHNAKLSFANQAKPTLAKQDSRRAVSNEDFDANFDANRNANFDARTDNDFDRNLDCALDFGAVDFTRLARYKRKSSARDLAAEFIEMFLEDSEQRFETLHEARRANDFDSLARTLHALKGSCANIGAARLAEACGALEQAAKDCFSNNRIAALEPDFARLEQEYRRVRKVLEAARAGKIAIETS